jgi:hypothetical protein
MRRSALFLVLLLVPLAARAASLWDLRAGAKGAFTGNIFTEPGNASFANGLWDTSEAWLGGGGGVFVEVRFLRFLGLELDLLYEANSFLGHVKTNGVKTHDLVTRFTQLRVPILVKGVLPLGLVDLSLGLGPEFVTGLSAGAGAENTTQYVSQAAKEAFDARVGAHKTSATMLAVDLGVAISLGRLSIPISLRGSFNLGQPGDWLDRVEVDTSKGTVTVQGIESIQVALLAGLAYVF